MTCSPANIHGPFKQHLFLGLSVSSFSTSLDLANNSSDLTVRLVEDPCTSVEGKIYYDGSLNLDAEDGPGTPKFLYTADPGFTYPEIGSPCYFRLTYLKDPDLEYDVEDNPYMGFEYCGLLQSYEEINEETGTVFVVKLTSPNEILQGANVILEEYTDTVADLYNLFNVYGYAESFGSPCPEITIGEANFGSAANAFGGSKSNANGIPLIIIKNTLQVFCSTPVALINDYNPYGRLMFRGSGANYGYGCIAGEGLNNLFANYLLDISELPVPLDPYASRMNGVISINDLISEACSDAGCDWYCEILPTFYLGQLYKFIKLRTIVRALQPDLGKIDAFLDSLETDSGLPIANSRSIGLELRNETTSALIIGGQKESIYQADDPNEFDRKPIFPYFGLHENSDTIETFYVKFNNGTFDPDPGDLGICGIFVDITKLNATLHNPLVLPANTSHIFITIDEIRAAKAGEEQWRMWSNSVNRYAYGPITEIKDFEELEVTDNFYNLVFAGGGGLLTNIETFGHLLKDKLTSAFRFDPLKVEAVLVDNPLAAKFNLLDFIKPNKDEGGPVNDHNTALLKDLTAIYNFVAGFAAYYGTKFMVKMPFDAEDDTVTVVKEDEYGVITYSEEPTDSGWPEYNGGEATEIIGLPASDAVYFTNESNKLECFCKFEISNADTTEANMPDSWYYHGGYLYVKGDVEAGTFVFGNYSGIRAGEDPEVDASYRSPRALVSIDTPIRQKIAANDITDVYKLINDIVEAMGLLLDDDSIIGGGKEFTEKIINKTTRQAVSTRMGAQAYMPVAIALPIKSNVLNYGPWSSSGTIIPGQTKAEIISGLVPWEYGSLSNMNDAGQYLANSKLTLMQKAEKGNITVAGFPTRPLGAELNTGALFLLESRNAITSGGSFGESNAITVDIDSWQGVGGPNITNISCEIGSGGITTSYELRTFTPKFNRFGKLTLERFQKAGQNLSKNRRSSFIKMKDRLGGMIRLAGKRGGGVGGVVAAGDAGGAKAAEITKDTTISVMSSEGSGCGVVAISGPAIVGELNDNFNKKAIMSLDGLFRGAKRKDASNGLSAYAAGATNEYLQYAATAIEPPLDNYTELQIYSDFIDPFVGKGSTLINDDRANGVTHHDIKIMNSDNIPSGSTGSMSLPADDFAGNNPYDGDPNYRFTALRGPLVISGWGYDLQGKPIPNDADGSNAALGDFSQEALKDKFLAQWLEKPETWPVGPVDLRFDRRRGVWTLPTGLRIVRAEITGSGGLTETNLTSSAKILQNDGRTLYNAEGTEIEEKQITVHVPFQDDDNIVNSIFPEVYAASGDVVVAYYNDYEGKYYALSTNGDSGVPFIYKDSYECPKYGVMEVYGEQTIDGKRYLQTRRPTATFKRRYLVNYSSARNLDEKGNGNWLEKSGRVLLNTSTGADLDTEWGVKKDNFGLFANRPGFHIIDVDTIDGSPVATAIQREVTELIGKLYSGSITKGSTGAINIYMGASGSEAATDFTDITCRARFAAIANSKWCVMSWRNGVWYVAQVEC